MKMFRLVLLFGVIALALTFCKADHVYEYNAKFTVTVNTPFGVKTASSVVYSKVSYRDKIYNFLDGLDSGVSGDFVGEAIVLDLGNNKVLFVLLQDGPVDKLTRETSFDDIANGNLYDPDPAIRVPKIQARIDQLKAAGKVFPVPPELTPYFVMFDDIKNPDKLIKVDPANMAATLGSGYSLKSLTMTYTDEPVTTGKVIAAVGEEFFEKWKKRMLSDIDGAEWKRQNIDFGTIIYRKAFISEKK